MCDILKIAEEELEFITGKKDIEDGVNAIRAKYSIPLITVTKGKLGSEAFFDDGEVSLHISKPTFMKVKSIDTTGAGDTFAACVLHDILENGYKTFTQERLGEILTFANSASSLITTKKGALCVMPDKTEIEALIQFGN